MQWQIEKSLVNLFTSWQGKEPDSISELPASGSNRMYFRLNYGKQSCIAAFNPDLRENRAFITLSNHFVSLGLPVPKIIATDTDGLCYLITDLGDTTLFSLLPHDPAVKVFSKQVIGLYKTSLEWLAQFQINGAKGLDFSICYPRHAFDRHSMMWDLNYFKYYFLKISDVAFDEQKLEDDFERFAGSLMRVPADFFLYRDFQSRNIMVVEGEPQFIDFQGGRRGALHYDVASLIFDAKANIPPVQRLELLDFYIENLGNWMKVDEKKFRKDFFDFALMRILQALGAYGFRGGVERKTLFLQSVPYALQNLRWLTTNNFLPESTPYLNLIIERLAEQAPAEIQSVPSLQGLSVHIRSFSYKNGIPPDEWGHGGGFVFDCRSLINPGRLPEYKPLTGKDTAIGEFLEKQEAVRVFLEQATNMSLSAIKNYIDRGFNHLMISFGCTGGQHRSVYCAEALARRLASLNKVNIDLIHCQEKQWPKTTTQ
ncbi:MAG TPA: RNase adapter RapZ [Bacteroidales bacterium]|nr:RNase adapter RapZ [Bacteroidales bacterium]